MYSNNKIIFLLWQDKPGGIEVIIPEIIKNLLGKEFFAFVFRPPINSKESVFDSTDVKPTYGSKYNLLLYLKLILYLRENRHAIFHGFNTGPVVYFILRILNIKRKIYSIHGTIYWRNYFQKFILKTIWFLSIKKSDIFLSNSNFSKTIFKDKISSKPLINVVYNPFDLKKFIFHKKENINKFKLKICYVGRLVHGKNLEIWIDIAEKLLEFSPEFEFNIYGDGSLKPELTDYIKNKNLVNKIFLRGFRSDIENVYKENDLLLFLSEYESFGNVVVESILCGTPVIASKIPAMEEIFKDYPQFLVPLDYNLTNNVLNKIDQYEMLMKLVSKASKEFKERFSMEKHIKELKKIYDSF